MFRHYLLFLSCCSHLLVALGALGIPSTSSAAIYSCIDAHGRRLTADRPIPECLTREQRLLNTDGSVRKIVPPSMTPDEQAEADARERRAAAERATLQDAIRRDRNLLARYPDQAAHQKARAMALNDVRLGVAFSEARLATLLEERKPLVTEAEFYAGRDLPAKLKRGLEGNAAAAEAQHALVKYQKEEILRIDALYDTELRHLQKLWAGALPGSLSPAAGAPPPPAARTPPAR